jgi:hypothetical protein
MLSSTDSTLLPVSCPQVTRSRIISLRSVLAPASAE